MVIRIKYLKHKPVVKADFMGGVWGRLELVKAYINNELGYEATYES